MASSSSSSSKKIILRSSDEVDFPINDKAAMLSVTIKNMIEVSNDSNITIPLPDVSSKTLIKVIDYCNKHSATENSVFKGFDRDELEQWDQKFLRVDEDTLFDLIVAAKYMEIRSLLDLTTQCFADNIKHLTAEEVRAKFNIENDFTPEEEAQIRSENQWAFD